MPAPERTVVVVEDDPGLRESLMRMLRAAGFTVRSHESAEDYLKSEGTASIHCLVLDVHLPGSSGLDLYEALRAIGTCPPAVFITALDEPIVCDRARAIGAAALLSKPFAGQRLVSAVVRAIDALP
jgi:FixJ family two-component response regulator